MVEHSVLERCKQEVFSKHLKKTIFRVDVMTDKWLVF